MNERGMDAAMKSAGSRAAPALAMLVTINLFNYIDRFLLAAAEPLIREEFFAPGDPHANSAMGLLPTAFLVSYMLAAPVFGWLGDRSRRWTLIAIGVLVWTLASGASGLAVSFGMLLVTRIFVGIGEAAYGPIAPTVIADMYPVSRRGSKLAWFYMAIPVGSALGFALGGTIAKNISWQWAFFAVVPPGIILAVWAFFFKDPPRGNAPVARAHGLADYLGLLRTPSYVWNVMGMTAMTFAVGGMSFWAPRYISEFRGAGELDHVNLIFGAITVVAGLSATLIGGRVGDLLTRRWPGAYFLVSGAGMLLGFPAFLGVLYMPFPTAWVFLFVAIFCLFFNTGPTNTIIANVTRPGVRATAFAMCILVIHLLGDAISPPLIGMVADGTRSDALPEGDLNKAFLLVGMAILVSGICWLMGARHLGKDTAAVEAATARNTMPAG